MAKMPEEPHAGPGGHLQFLSTRSYTGREDALVEIDINNGALRRSAGLEGSEPFEGSGPAVSLLTPQRTSSFPRWLRALDTLHRTSRSPFVVATDLAVAIACGLGARVALREVAPLCLGLIFALYISGKYTDRAPLETQGVLWFLGEVSMPLALAALTGAGFQASFHWPFAHTLRTAVAATGGLLSLRAVTWFILVQARRRGLGLRRTLVVGDGPAAALIERKLKAYPEAGLAPVNSLSFTEDRTESSFNHVVSAARLTRIVKHENIEEVVLAPDGSDDEILTVVKAADGLDPHFSILLPLSEVFLHPGLVTQVGGLPLISLGRIAQSRTPLPGKRLFDLGIAGALLVLLSPLLAMAAIAIKIFDGGPVIYRQKRVGRGGKPFELLKFRSMVVGAERLIVDLRDRNANTGLLFKIYDDPRITPLGRIIRRLSIDELPQLWNVVRGDMSLVGPRPLAVEPEEFGPIENKRHSVLPGITGYWQIAGCNDLTYEEMIKLDLAYIQNRSLFLDLRLLLRTPAALIHRRGPF
jgi:exopolysaccharide biosynthesis polyprenyl glycosylphosphotransferase